jgi:hypothetical protein
VSETLVFLARQAVVSLILFHCPLPRWCLGSGMGLHGWEWSNSRIPECLLLAQVSLRSWPLSGSFLDMG